MSVKNGWLLASSDQNGQGRVASLAALAQRRPLKSAAIGLWLVATSSPVTAEQVASSTAAPTRPPPPTQASRAILPQNSEGTAWPQIKHVISVLESLTAPIDPDELATLLDLNRSAFNRTKIVRPFPAAPGSRLVTSLVQYTGVPDNTNSIITTTSISISKDPQHLNDISREHIIIDIYATNNCVTFSAIRPDAAIVGWDGHGPGYYTGADGVSYPDFDIVYFQKQGIITSIRFDKKTSCATDVSTGTIKDLENKDAQ
jgi:hypothetical protein